MSEPATPSQQIAAAARLLASGDAAGAERVAEDALRAAPDDVDALMLLAMVKRQRGDLSAALAAIEAAVRATPDNAAIQFARGNLLLELKRHEEALATFDGSLRLRPDHAPASLHRGLALRNLGRNEEAVAAFDVASARGVDIPMLHAERGLALTALGRTEEALASFTSATRLSPADATAHYNRARSLQALDRLDEAVAAYDEALRIAPSADIYDSRGVALHDADRLDEALASFAEALRSRPDHPPTLANRGLTLFALKRAREAVDAFDRALALSKPEESASLRYNRAMASLAVHDFADGWPRFASRWDANLVSSPPHDRHEPQWSGERLAGALRIWPEQGVGDEILLARFAAWAHERTPSVVLECAERLAPLFARSFSGVVVRSVSGASDTAAAQIAAGDLPAALEVASISGAAYLRADAEKTGTLRARYSSFASGRPIVGIAWSSKASRRGPYKSASLSEWGALLTRDCFFVNLQYGDVAAEIAEAQTRFGCTIHNDASVNQITDLDAFAAQVAAMDVVVSVSNTTVHVAGALGVKCIVMVPPARGRLWYWGLEGEATPWYDSVRIVRRDIGEGRDAQVAAAAALL